MTALTAAARRVLLLAIDAHRDRPETARWLHDQLCRLDEPLRVAIAGKVKAGKSTLLNALVGEQVAPTDAGECTRVVTWYRDGATPKIVLHRRDGAPRALPVRRHDGALTIDLGGTPAEQCARLVVDWPAQSLRSTTLIDTPGIASTSTAVSQRTVDFLDPDDDTPTEADAVVYLMRHVHAQDAAFLEAFRDRGVARATAVNTVAVLSRADEIGGGRVDAMFSARGIAARYRADPTVRGLCQNVVAVAGLLAETGRTLRQGEHTALAALAGVPRDDLEAELLSVDRFLRAGRDGTVSADVRGRLLDRFGLFGIRLSTSLIRQGADTPVALAGELVARSGLGELEQVLHTQFTERRDVLKARSALLAVEGVLRGESRGDARGGTALAREIEKVLAGAHEFTELRLLGTLRSGAVTLPTAAAAEAERLLGDAGTTPPARLGLPADVAPEEVRRAAFAALDRWQRHAVNPMLGRATAEACRAVVRSCEGVVAAAITQHHDPRGSTRGCGGLCREVPPGACTRTYSSGADPGQHVPRRTGGTHGRTGSYGTRQHGTEEHATGSATAGPGGAGPRGAGPVMIAQADRTHVEPDDVVAERAWHAGDALAAIEAADRALATGTDREGRAAAVVAAGAAADGGLLDAAARWRGVADALDGAAAARARARAALAAGLAGDVTTAVGDLAAAHRLLPDPAPRGLTVLLGGAGAVVEAVAGEFDKASRHLAGLATVAVPPDPMAAERWDELAVTVTAAGGGLDAARAVLRGATAPTGRGRLLAAWLALRTGHLAEARERLAAGPPVLLRRDALLGAAVGVGLTRRGGAAAGLAAAWHRAAPVLAGADVEPLLLDVWGELSVAAEQVSPADRDVVVDAMRAAVDRAGSPWWAVAAEQWWRLERAVVVGDAPTAADAAARLGASASTHPRLRARADAAAAWAGVLAGRVCPVTVDAASAGLGASGLRFEAAALCRAAADRTTDPAAARRLLGAGRGLRTASAAPGRGRPGGLSDREREVGALVVDGLTHKEIGARLYISPKTVEQHVARLRQKLAASTRATLVAALRPHLDD